MNNYVNVIFSNYHPWYPRIPEFLVIAKGNTDVRLKKKNRNKGPRNNDQHSSNKNRLYPNCGLQILFPTKRNQSIMKNWLILGNIENIYDNPRTPCLTI